MNVDRYTAPKGADIAMENGANISNNSSAPRGTSPSGKRAEGRMLSSDPLQAIRELSFVKAELELYLDTHPNCKTAIDYYHQTVDALTRLMEQYQSEGNPIVAAGSVDKNKWKWVSEPWPWQRPEDLGKGDEF